MDNGENEHLGKNLGEMGTGHMGCPFSPNVHLPQGPFVNIWGNGIRALGVPVSPKCAFSPRDHLPQCPFAYIWGK